MILGSTTYREALVESISPDKRGDVLSLDLPAGSAWHEVNACLKYQGIAGVWRIRGQLTFWRAGKVVSRLPLNSQYVPAASLLGGAASSAVGLQWRGSDGLVYECIAANGAGHPPPDANYWKLADPWVTPFPTAPQDIYGLLGCATSRTDQVLLYDGQSRDSDTYQWRKGVPSLTLTVPGETDRATISILDQMHCLNGIKAYLAVQSVAMDVELSTF